MEFHILGPLEVRDQGRVVKLGGTKQRSLLAFLLLHANQAVSRDRLIDELWGDQPPETATTAIQVHVSQLRKALGRDVIVTQPPGYLIRIGDDELDLERFERSAGEAQTAPPAEASQLLSEALGLWRGPPLAELDAPFARDVRMRLDEQRLAVLEQRIDADLALGRHAQLIPELEGLVREHPLREHLRGQLMVALYRSGRQAEALDVYRAGRRLLDEELGLEPGEELRRLERAILGHDPSLAAWGRPAESGQPAHVPSGTVTFVFTDIEASTRLVQRLGDDYGALLERHHDLVRNVLGEHGGEEVDTQGDAFFFAFRRARDAVRGAVELQKHIADTRWPADAIIRIRVGIHTGEPGIAETGYHGLDVVRAARISGSAHGGQILVSSATRDLVGAALEDVTFLDLGEHRLKDLEHSQRIFQVLAPGLEADFPPLTTTDAARVMTISGREHELASAAEAALETEERRVRLFRRSRIVAAAGALILLAAAVAIGIAVTSGSEGSAVTVAPDSVAVLDTDGKLVGDVPIGGRPISLAMDDDAVWVANADDGTLLRIDRETYEVVETIGLGADVNSVAVGFGSVWVAGGNSENVFRIDPRENAIEETIQLGKADPLRPDPVFFVAAGRKAVWVTQGSNVLRIDPRTNKATKTIALPSATSGLHPVPVDLGAGGGNVWVPMQDERLVRIDEGASAISATTQLPGEGFSPDVGAGGLWLILGTETPQVSKLDPSNLTQTASIPFPSTKPEDFPVDLATAAGTVWVVDHGRSLVWRIASTTAKAEQVATVGYHPISVAAAPDTVWVGVQEFTFGESG